MGLFVWLDISSTNRGDFAVSVRQSQTTHKAITNRPASPSPDRPAASTQIAHSEANFNRVYDPDHDMTCSPGGPVYITNVLATLAPNGSVTVTFDIQGGTNGVFYDFGQTNVPPAATSNVMAIAAGYGFSVALKNDGTLVEWGNNGSGQTNVPLELPTSYVAGTPPNIQTIFEPPIVVKSIAAGSDHSMAAIFSPVVQYPIDVSKDLLLL